MLGIVYRAVDEQLRREVALKVLPKELQQNAERLRRFTNEARAASSLNHPNVLTVHEVGEIDGAPFITMELVDVTAAVSNSSMRQPAVAGQIRPGFMG